MYDLIVKYLQVFVKELTYISDSIYICYSEQLLHVLEMRVPTEVLPCGEKS